MSHKKHVFFGKIDLASNFHRIQSNANDLATVEYIFRTIDLVQRRGGKKEFIVVWWMERKQFCRRGVGRRPLILPALVFARLGAWLSILANCDFSGCSEQRFPGTWRCFSCQLFCRCE